MRASKYPGTRDTGIIVTTHRTLYQSGYIDAKKTISSVEIMPNTNAFSTECGRDILAVMYAPSNVNAMPQKYPTVRSAVSLANLCKNDFGGLAAAAVHREKNDNDHAREKNGAENV